MLHRVSEQSSIGADLSQGGILMYPQPNDTYFHIERSDFEFFNMYPEYNVLEVNREHNGRFLTLHVITLSNDEAYNLQTYAVDSFLLGESTFVAALHAELIETLNVTTCALEKLGDQVVVSVKFKVEWDGNSLIIIPICLNGTIVHL